MTTAQRIAPTVAKLRRFAKRCHRLQHKAGGLFWRAYPHQHYFSGWCYLVSEVLYWAHPEVDFRPYRMVLTPPNNQAYVAHWFLVDGHDGRVFDYTAAQMKQPLDYSVGRRRPYRSRVPSHAAQALADAAGIKLKPRKPKHTGDGACLAELTGAAS